MGSGNPRQQIDVNNPVSPPSGSVTLDDLAPLAPFSVIGNQTDSTATPTAVKMNCIPGVTFTATAAGTTTLTATSTGTQVFTGTTTQTITLPVVNTFAQTGFGYWIVNDSSGALTVNSSGGNLVATVVAGGKLWVFAKALAGTGASAWEAVSFAGITNGAAANVIPKSDGTNLVTSNLSDDGSVVTSAVKVRLPDGTSAAAAIGWSDGTGLYRDGGGAPDMLVGTTRVNAWYPTFLLADTTVSYGWGAINGGSMDTAIARIAATIAKITDGASALGWLKQVSKKRTTANVTNETTEGANLSDLSVPLVAGRSYSGFLGFFANNSTATDGLKIDFDGGSATMTSVQFGFSGTPVGATLGVSQSTALSTAITVTTATTADIFYLVGFTCVCDAGGTLIPRMANFTAVGEPTGTATVKLGAFIDLEDNG